ncbi:hypothetical protein NPIL_50671 [Nephila pilipes]|uniref:Uncharacterized protein n=1 Tax=Nephila pilipes TaxID=299642 RepID=A0A8X6IB27_NEPPI|nr:hypothetical protein NPIL_50671 [Nephila pilipes]
METSADCSRMSLKELIQSFEIFITSDEIQNIHPGQRRSHQNGIQRPLLDQRNQADVRSKQSHDNCFRPANGNQEFRKLSTVSVLCTCGYGSQKENSTPTQWFSNNDFCLP